MINGIRAALKTANLPEEYRTYAARDVANKYNLCVHSRTGHIPLVEWSGPNAIPARLRLFTFGQIGAIHAHGAAASLTDPGRWARYLHADGRSHILVLLQNGTVARVRSADFHPYSADTDPKRTSAALFNFHRGLKRAMKAKRKHGVPTSITPATLPPMCLAQSRLYPDAQQWAMAHDRELDTLEHMQAIEWLDPAFRNARTHATIDNWLQIHVACIG